MKSTARLLEGRRYGLAIAFFVTLCVAWPAFASSPGPMAALNPRSSTAFADWKEIHSREGGFKVAFPTEPKYVRKEIESGAGKLVNHTYTLDEGPISFTASWLEFPPRYVREAGHVRILSGAQEAFFKRFKGKVLSEKIVTLGVTPGRDVVYETEDEVRFRLRIFLRGQKLIQTLVMCEPDLIETADAKRFFDSLKWD